MKHIENFFKGACAYTVIILSLFYIMANAIGVEELSVSFGRYALILLLGAFISAAGFLFKLDKIHRAFSLIAHYSVLLLTFCIIFITSGILSGGSSRIFVAVVIFTVFYAVISLAVYFSKKGVAALDRRIDKKAPQKSKKKENQPYTSKFKNNV